MDWGPPMESVVYLVLSRSNDQYHILYAGESEKTEDVQFFPKNPSFKCWIEKTGADTFTHLAILPLWDSTQSERKRIVDKIISRFNPPCN